MTRCLARWPWRFWPGLKRRSGFYALGNAMMRLGRRCAAGRAKNKIRRASATRAAGRWAWWHPDSNQHARNSDIQRVARVHTCDAENAHSHMHSRQKRAKASRGEAKGKPAQNGGASVQRGPHRNLKKEQETTETSNTVQQVVWVKVSVRIPGLPPSAALQRPPTSPAGAPTYACARGPC